jgi:uncharacterized membrane protein
MVHNLRINSELSLGVTNKKVGVKPMLKNGVKSFKVLICLIVLVFNLVVFAQISFADTASTTGGGSLTIPGEVTNIGGATDANGAATDITKELDKWITNLRVIGAVAAIFGIVIGAILFSVSLGNSQRRGLAISAMLSAGGGIIIIAKAHTIAGYFIHSS